MNHETYRAAMALKKHYEGLIGLFDMVEKADQIENALLENRRLLAETRAELAKTVAELDAAREARRVAYAEAAEASAVRQRVNDEIHAARQKARDEADSIRREREALVAQFK